MPRLLTRLVTLFLFMTAALSAQTVPYENLVIEKIDISIANAPPDLDYNYTLITNRMKTRAGDVFSQTVFDGDLKILIQEYDRVEPCLDVVNCKLYITLKIWLRPQIRTIRWEGNCAYSSKDLQKELGMEPGAIFDRLAFNKGFNKLRAYYVKKGYYEAELDYDVEFDDVTNDVDIVITVNEGRCGKVKNIIYEGLTSCEIEEIEEMMVTKEYNFFMSWFTDEGIYSNEAMQHDQFVILTYLQNHGYADAKVSVEIVDVCSNRINVIIRADKGDLYTFGELTFEGNCIFTDEQIRSRFTIETGCPYSPEKVRETMLRIVDLYGKFGYIDAVADFEPTLNPDCPIYDLHFEIEEGEQFRIGLIKVFGNCSTQTNVILHECLLIPGEIFNILKLKKTEERLHNIGYFKCVNVYAVRTEDCSELGGNYRDVHIEVDETNTGNFSAYAGFSNLESIFGGFSITEKNFNIRGFPRVFKDGYRAMRGGGEYAYFNTTIGSKSRSYSFSWAKPYFNDTPWIVGFDIEQSNVRYISNDYYFNSIGLNVHGKLPINDYMRVGVHYRIKNTAVHVVNAGNLNELLVKEAKNSGLISAAGAAFYFDSTDCPRKPTKGWRSTFQWEYAGLGGDHHFFGFAYTNTWYWKMFTRKGIFKARCDNRFLVPVGNTSYLTMPLDERLYLGGENVVRGYKQYALGPKFPGTNDPRGGLSLNLLSIEYSHPIWKRLDGFLFCDAGHLSPGLWHIGEFKTSVGFGVRFVVFENGPPISLGFGFPINPENDRDDVQNFFFNLGAQF